MSNIAAVVLLALGYLLVVLGAFFLGVQEGVAAIGAILILEGRDLSRGRGR